MTEQFTNDNTIAPLKNVAAMTMLIKQLENRDHGMPGMGLFYGPAGFGKSYSALHAANTVQACVVQCKSTWTARDLCQSILFNLGGTPKGTCTFMVNQISQILAQTNVPLLIDEADFLIKKKSIEVVRDVYESSFSTIILIGEETLPQKLQKWERFHSRILKSTAARAADADDLRVLQGMICKGIMIDPDVIADLRNASKGSVRRMVVNLSLLKEFAAKRGADTVSKDDWKTHGFHTGIAPAPRRVIA